MMQEVDDEAPVAAVVAQEEETLPPGPPSEVPVADSTHANADKRGSDILQSATTASTEDDEKAVLINQVLELQNTLDELSGRVNRVKEENSKLKSENEVLTQYIENLMASSSVIQSNSGNNSNSTGSKKTISSLWSSLGGKKT